MTVRDDQAAPADNADPTRPVGARGYVVRAGDDMSRIADDHGFFWETLWNHAENAELKRERRNPNVLLEGDRVFIPELDEGSESCATEKRHRFRRKGVPSSITLVLRRFGEPRADIEFEFEADDLVTTGRTDDQGRLTVPVPPGATRGVLTLKGQKRTETQVIKIGSLDPIESVRGLQQRLSNLNYACDETGKLDDQTRDALRTFQARHDLDVTETPDPATRDKLQEVHGC